MKKLLFTILLSSISLICFSQTTISGVVTYYFNEYQGNKADIGASVILIDSVKVKNFNYKLYENYNYGKSYQNIYFSSQLRYERYLAAFKKTEGKKKYLEDNEKFRKGMEDAKNDMENNMKQIVLYEYDTPEKAAKNSSALYIQLIKLGDDLPKKTVDGTGQYSLTVKPGIYYVYIKSKNRYDKLDILELDGKVYIEKIKISENENKDVSKNFEL